MTRSQQPDSKLSRRLLVKVAAILCGLRLTGCSRAPKSPDGHPKTNADPAEAANSPEPEREVVSVFTDQGYRLYGIVPEDQATFDADVLPTLEMQLFYWSQSLPRSKKLTQPDRQLPFTVAVWGTPGDAEALRKLSGVKSVIEKLPEHVLEIGSTEDAPGTLSVIFAPLPNGPVLQDATSATLQQIAQAWQEAFSEFDGVAVKPVLREERPLNDMGHFPAAQMIIEFTTPMLNAEVLKVIKEHPQTMQLKWDGMFTDFYCPPCGMG